jgi:hypothetical protein
MAGGLFCFMPARGQAVSDPSQDTTVTLTIPLLPAQSVPPEAPSAPLPGAKPVPTKLTLAGPSDAKSILHADIPLLRRILVKPEDLQQIKFPFKVDGAASGNPKISIYRMLRDYQGGAVQSGTDYDAQPVASLTVNGQKVETPIEAQGPLAQLLQKWLTGAACCSRWRAELRCPN